MDLEQTKEQLPINEYRLTLDIVKTYGLKPITQMASLIGLIFFPYYDGRSL